MKNLEIRQLEPTDLEVFLRYTADWKTDTSLFKIDETSIYNEISKGNFADWQKQIRREEIEVRNPDWSTCTKYFAFVGGEIAGVCSCRWQIEKGILLEWGGHIGYGVAPSFRGAHLAAQMVTFALEKYRERGIFSVMISADKDNVASRKTIEQCGGVLENIVDIDGNKVCRYWIDLR
ncbi:GNAT family N-acetyltransferase [Lactococcus allomyrinae]|uniref:GNAT family N-acetyltransferase n=1 Tax=Lactococcus allomyrinae TaxID=2419773 RepID=A0A387BI83_9LACT|nr:GNAT family N-acetyltransferase [Lactococcus allomyrinae]AYG01894.1 GNAT family N-acetyltransferase [Lactococcus allomyrinae]